MLEVIFTVSCDHHKIPPNAVLAILALRPLAYPELTRAREYGMVRGDNDRTCVLAFFFFTMPARIARTIFEDFNRCNMLPITVPERGC